MIDKWRMVDGLFVATHRPKRGKRRIEEPFGIAAFFVELADNLLEEARGHRGVVLRDIATCRHLLSAILPPNNRRRNADSAAARHQQVLRMVQIAAEQIKQKLRDLAIRRRQQVQHLQAILPRAFRRLDQIVVDLKREQRLPHIVKDPFQHRDRHVRRVHRLDTRVIPLPPTLSPALPSKSIADTYPACPAPRCAETPLPACSPPIPPFSSPAEETRAGLSSRTAPPADPAARSAEIAPTGAFDARSR